MNCRIYVTELLENLALTDLDNFFMLCQDKVLTEEKSRLSEFGFLFL